MRLEYRIELAEVGVPRFSVEAQEGISKLFTLCTVVLNVLDSKPVVEIVFHGLNREDPDRKIGAFREILESVQLDAPVEIDVGPAGQIGTSSSYYKWVRVRQ
jgi:hypothetical protein